MLGTWPRLALRSRYLSAWLFECLYVLMLVSENSFGIAVMPRIMYAVVGAGIG